MADATNALAMLVYRISRYLAPKLLVFKVVEPKSFDYTDKK